MQELNFLEVTIQDIKFKIKTIHAMYTAELAKVIKSERCGVGLHGTHVLKLFWFKPINVTAFYLSFFQQFFSH